MNQFNPRSLFFQSLFDSTDSASVGGSRIQSINQQFNKTTGQRKKIRKSLLMNALKKEKEKHFHTFGCTACTQRRTEFGPLLL